MIQSNTIIPSIQVAAGQYTTVKVGFFSDEMLSGKVLRFNPGFYTSIGTPVAKAFQILYSPSAGTFEFEKINCKNGIAFLKVIDAYNFEIEYRFFATKNLNGWIPDTPYFNANALFDIASFEGGLGIYVKVGIDEAKAIVPIELTEFCETAVVFTLRNTIGYIPGKDLDIDILTDGTTSNNFYAGIIKNDSIANKGDIVKGLISSYSKVGSSILPVYDLPNEAFDSGIGFMQTGNDSKATLTIKGDFLKPDSSYNVYIVYYQNGKWQSCISEPIVQKSLKEPIEPKVTYSFTDEFGNTTDKACIKGLSRYASYDLCVTIDDQDFDDKVARAGYGDQWQDFAVGIKAFVGKGISSQSGAPLTVTGSNPYCISGFKPGNVNQAFVIFQLGMEYPEQRDIINIPFDLTFNAPNIDIEVNVFDANGEVKELCEGGDYIISEAFEEDCLILQSIDGNKYLPSTILSSLDLDESQMPIDSEVCLKVVCAQSVESVDCPCESIIVQKSSYSTSLGSQAVYFSFGDGASWSATIVPEGILSQFIPLLQGGEEDFFEINVQVFDIIESIEIDVGKGDCKYRFTDVASKLEPVQNASYVLNADCSDYVEDVDLICNNYASLDIDCNEDTQVTTISLVKNLDSAIEQEDFLISYDGGITFAPCPETVIGEANMFITYDVTFTDKCEKIHIEQNVNCIKYTQFANSRSIELEVVDNLLEITFTDDFNSNVLSDLLFVSVDAGKTFKEFDLLGAGYIPITLIGGEDIVAYSNTVFEDAFSDITVTKSLKNTIIIPDTACDGYGDYDMTLIYDEEESTFIVNHTGDVSVLEISEIKWTLNGGNPFDENGSGVTYSAPVVGEGMFIARWKIQIKGCEPKFLDAVGFGKSCIKLCDDIVVNVKLTDQPIKMCIVECCDEFYSIICEEPCTLVVVGDLTDCFVNWTGPGGFIGVGAEVVVELDGTYHASIQCADCLSSASYEFKHVSAGTPINDEIEL